jgi:hypothetical protein
VALRSRISWSGKRLQPSKKVALETFHARAADPALAKRLTARIGSAASRRAAKDAREGEKAEKKARDAERAQQADALEAIGVSRSRNQRILSVLVPPWTPAPGSGPTPQDALSGDSGGLAGVRQGFSYSAHNEPPTALRECGRFAGGSTAGRQSRLFCSPRIVLPARFHGAISEQRCFERALAGDTPL